MANIPEKLFFKIGEVCELTETQPYVLRFWESEFPQLAPKKNRSGQRIYSSEDIEVVQEIKRLLYDSGFTIAGSAQAARAGRRAPPEVPSPAESQPGEQGRGQEHGKAAARWRSQAATRGQGG